MSLALLVAALSAPLVFEGWGPVDGNDGGAAVAVIAPLFEGAEMRLDDRAAGRGAIVEAVATDRCTLRLRMRGEAGPIDIPFGGLRAISGEGPVVELALRDAPAQRIVVRTRHLSRSARPAARLAAYARRCGASL